MEMIDEATVEFMTDFIRKLTEKQFEERVQKGINTQPFAFKMIFKQFHEMGIGQASTNYISLGVVIHSCYDYFYKITVPMIQKQQIEKDSYPIKRISKYIDISRATDESILEVCTNLRETIKQPTIMHLVSNILVDNEDSILILQKEHVIECYSAMVIFVTQLDLMTEKALKN